jgi:hypothetical protein
MIISKSVRGIRGLLCPLVCAVLLSSLLAQAAAAAELNIDSVRFVSPTDGFSRYHLAVNVTNGVGEAVTVTSAVVDEESRETFAVFLGGELSKDDSIPSGAKGCVRFSCPWHNSARYSVEVRAKSVDGSRTFAAKTTANAPSRGGYWNAEWKGYKVVGVAEEAGLDRENEPVVLALNFRADQLRDPHKELRLVEMSGSGVYTEVPFQILETSSVDVEGEKYPDTVACDVLFYASVPANSSRCYIVFFDNPDAAAPPPPSSEVTVEGEGLGLTVDNPYYRVTLAEQSGQINGIFVKQGVGTQLSHGGNAIHWNPGCYSPPRPWGHTYDWNPPEGKSEIRGPLVYTLKRWGCLPKLPEVWVSVTYTFYAHVPYFVMSSTIGIRDDINVLALRNDEMVFEPQLFSELGWRDKQGAVNTVPLRQDPALETGYTRVLPADVPWLCFFQPAAGYGFGSVRLAYDSTSTMEADATKYNEGTYVTAPSGSLVYWYRALVYHFFPTAPVQLFKKVTAGSVYHETNAYLPFPLGEAPANKLDPINETYERLTHPLRVITVDWGRDDLVAVGQKEQE